MGARYVMKSHNQLIALLEGRSEIFKPSLCQFHSASEFPGLCADLNLEFLSPSPSLYGVPSIGNF